MKTHMEEDVLVDAHRQETVDFSLAVTNDILFHVLTAKAVREKPGGDKDGGMRKEETRRR